MILLRRLCMMITTTVRSNALRQKENHQLACKRAQLCAQSCSPETRASLLVRLLKQRLVAGSKYSSSPDYKNGLSCASLMPCIFILPLTIVNFSFLSP
jgi:hypothetical protein